MEVVLDQVVDGKSVYRPDELAAKWGVNRRTIYDLIESGRLKAFRVGRRYRVLATEVANHEAGER